jgi:hypothetical protein
MNVFLPQVLYVVWFLSRIYVHKNICKNNLQMFFNKATAQIRNNVRVRIFNVGLLDSSQFASRRSCDRTTQSRFSLVYLGPRAIAELVSKLHVGLHASQAALPMVILKILP